MKNLMRPLAARLEDGYCSVTVANHQLITVIRFVAKNYTNPWRGWLYFVLHVRFSSRNVCSRISRMMWHFTKQGQYIFPCVDLWNWNWLVYMTFICLTLSVYDLIKIYTAWLEDSYCSITVANHWLVTVIRFVVKSYTHPWKSFANRLHLTLHAGGILFSRNVRARIIE